MDPNINLFVGDRVVVREDLKEKYYEEKETSLVATTAMTALAGKTVEITSVVFGWNSDGEMEEPDDPRRYFVREEFSCEDVSDFYGVKLFWCPAMFSGFAEDANAEPIVVPHEDIFDYMMGGKSI